MNLPPYFFCGIGNLSFLTAKAHKISYFYTFIDALIQITLISSLL